MKKNVLNLRYVNNINKKHPIEIYTDNLYDRNDLVLIQYSPKMRDVICLSRENAIELRGYLNIIIERNILE